MQFETPFKPAKLLRRYKRFLADIELPSGDIQTIHCPNTGSMRSCNMPGSSIWYSTSNNLQRKYPHTWEIIQNAQQHLIGINTHRANGLVTEAVLTKTIAELQGYTTLKTEVKYGQQNSRIDLLLSRSDEYCYVEVKNTTLAENEIAYFPDAVTARGYKHLLELMAMRKQGHRAVLCFCVQHTGVKAVRVADFIDPLYAETLHEAMTHGVEVLCYQAAIAPEAIVLNKKLPFLVDP